MCWRNLLTGETGDAIGHEAIREFFRETEGAIYIGHNILKFDAPHLVRLLGVRLSVRNCIDTLVLSTLYSPSLSGGHSLGAWGERLGFPKGDFKEFHRYSEEMLVYCRQDVLITAKLFVSLMKTLERIGFSEESLEIQHQFTVLINRQHNNGFYFDGKRALDFYRALRSVESDIGECINEAFPPALECLGTYKRPVRKDGSYSAQYLRHSEIYEDVELDPDRETYRVYGRTPFNIGSPKQRVEKLMSLGWVPAEFTEKGSPKPFDKGKLSPSLEKFLEDKDVPEVKLIAQWMAINGRANMVNTWLENYNEEDSCIHGKLFTADTLRLRHQSPNTANIPAVRVREEKNGSGQVVAKHILYGLDGYFTYESRDLWTARPGRVLVGTDAAGLELRMLAHYLNRPDFTDQVVNGDPHQYNADVVGITRPQAKTLIYAIMYGAAAPKIANTLGIPVKEGARIRHMFLDRLGIGDLMEECQNEQKNGRVSLVDGSQVVCPSPHAALNYKLQGGGARVMAKGAIILDRYVRRNRWDVLKVGDIHDEWQNDSDPDIAEELGRTAVQSIVESGLALRLNVPLDGESKIGKTWAETH